MLGWPSLLTSEPKMSKHQNVETNLSGAGAASNKCVHAGFVESPPMSGIAFDISALRTKTNRIAQLK